MTRIVLLAVCGAIAGCGGSGGQRHTSTAGKFSIKMPGTPKESVQNVPTAVGNLPAHSLMAEDWNRFVFGVTYFDFPPNLLQAGNVDAALEGSCEGMVANVKGKTLEKTNITLGSHPGREVRFEMQAPKSNEAGLGLSRIYVVGERFYQLLVVGPAARFNNDKAKAFLDSFQLLDEPSTSAGTTTSSSPSPSPAPSAVSPAAPSSGGPAVAAIPGGWGTPEDPSRDCKIQAQGPSATIEVPGSVHNLATPPQTANAPRLLQRVDGDFIAEVKVVSDEPPVDPPAPASNVAFHGAGLLLWGDQGNFVRLERAAFVRGGQTRQYVLFERHLASIPPQESQGNDPGGPLFLRLERRGDQVTASSSSDGTNWHSLVPIHFSSPSAKVGVAAVNTASAPFTARFEGLTIRKP